MQFLMHSLTQLAMSCGNYSTESPSLRPSTIRSTSSSWPAGWKKITHQILPVVFPAIASALRVSEGSIFIRAAIVGSLRPGPIFPVGSVLVRSTPAQIDRLKSGVRLPVYISGGPTQYRWSVE